MTGYYTNKLSGSRLERCYEVAPTRVRQYLEAEIRHVLERLRSTDSVLELGCGYGRIARRLATVAHHVVGIDTASESLELARRMLEPGAWCEFMQMDALDLRFPDCAFDAVVCLQNGICAFGVDQEALLREALRVTREGGMVLFSTYTDGIWPERLAWFEAQAAEGLVGAIDYTASHNGVIVCDDGFRAGRMTAGDFRSLCSEIGVAPMIAEVDGSILFCEIIKPGAAQQGDASDRATRCR